KGDKAYQCLLRGRRFKAGGQLRFYKDASAQKRIPLSADIVDILAHPAMTTYVLRFECEGSPEDCFEAFGETPLPPYIPGSSAAPDQYQTVFAKDTGSAAAPTAGLHFTPELIGLMRQRYDWEEVTLHVGMGTFLPLRNENVT